MTAMPDPLPGLLRATRLPEQPGAFFHAFAAALRAAPGFRFVTVFVIHGGHTVRVFSTDEAHYPTNVAKPMRATPWWDQVVGRQESFLAVDDAAVEAAFFDHALIRSLGCGSVMSVPVVFGGRCLGVVNVNDRAHAYGESDVRTVERLALAAAAAMLDILHALGDS